MKRALSLLLALLVPGPAFAHDCGFSSLCARDKAYCQDGQALDADTDALSAARESNEAMARKLTLLNDRFRALRERAKSSLFERRLREDDLSPAVCLGRKINSLSWATLPAEMSELGGELDRLAARADALDRAMGTAGEGESRAGLSRELSAINAEGSKLWERVRDVGFNSDDLSPWGSAMIKGADGTKKRSLSPSARLLPANNLLHGRLADLAQRLHGLDARLGGEGARAAAREGLSKAGGVIAGLEDPFSDGGGSSERRVRPAPVPDLPLPDPLTPKRGVPLPLTLAPAATLLDMRRSPPPPSHPKRSRRLSGIVDAVKRLFGETSPDASADPKEMWRIEALRHEGLTRTVGDPVGRARLVFQQTGATCGIAAQVQVLLDTGAAPRGTDPRALEEGLLRKAEERGYFEGAAADPERRWTGGTPGNYLGNLLDMPVKKHFEASVEELDAAVKRGRMLLASADTGLLWNDKRFANAGHIFVVTGAEIDPKTRKILGYYINDTGTGEGGRLVAAGQFRSAWKKNGAGFVEPL